jgi:uncharacterized protein (AIM24 family)
VELQIAGTVAQMAVLTMGRGEAVWATKGAIIGHDGGITWDVRVPGGLAGGLKRALAGEGISLTYAESGADRQVLLLGADAPGQIAEWDLQRDGPVLTTRGAFLAAWGPEIDISVSMARRPGAAMFGGAGLVLQRVQGRGLVLIHGRGDFRRVELGSGQELLVSTGNLAAFSSRVDYDIKAVGSLSKTLFGKEGLFMTRLAGPGTVLLQSMKPAAKQGS